MGTIFITGASGGLGGHVTRRLLQDGWTLQAAVHRREAADQLARQFTGFPIQVSVVDITRRDEVENWVRTAADMDGLVHLAGGFRGGSELSASSDADYDFLFNLHARATFYLLAAVMPILKKRGWWSYRNGGGAYGPQARQGSCLVCRQQGGRANPYPGSC